MPATLFDHCSFKLNIEIGQFMSSALVVFKVDFAVLDALHLHINFIQ